MLDNMTATQAAEWMEFANVEPFGFEVSSLQNGILGAAIANFSGVTKKRFKADQFMLKPGGSSQTPEDHFAIFKALAAAQQKQK